MKKRLIITSLISAIVMVFCFTHKSVDNDELLYVSVSGYNNRYTDYYQYLNTIEELVEMFEQYESDERIELINYSLEKQFLITDFGKADSKDYSTSSSLPDGTVVYDYHGPYFTEASAISPGTLLDTAGWTVINRKCLMRATLFSVNSIDTILDNADFNLSASNGSRMFTSQEMEEGAMVCLVPNSFCYYVSGEKLKPGDTVTLSAISVSDDQMINDCKQFSLTVTGTYSLSTTDKENRIIVPAETLLKIHQESASVLQKCGQKVNRYLIDSSYEHNDSAENVHYYDFAQSQKLSIDRTYLKLRNSADLADVVREIQNHLTDKNLTVQPVTYQDVIDDNGPQYYSITEHVAGSSEYTIKTVCLIPRTGFSINITSSKINSLFEELNEPEFKLSDGVQAMLYLETHYSIYDDGEVLIKNVNGYYRDFLIDGDRFIVDSQNVTIENSDLVTVQNIRETVDRNWMIDTPENWHSVINDSAVNHSRVYYDIAVQNNGQQEKYRITQLID